MKCSVGYCHDRAVYRLVAWHTMATLGHYCEAHRPVVDIWTEVKEDVH